MKYKFSLDILSKKKYALETFSDSFSKSPTPYFAKIKRCHAKKCGSRKGLSRPGHIKDVGPIGLIK